MFWQRQVHVQRTMYVPEGTEIFGADPKDPPDRHVDWVEMDGPDYRTVPAVSALHWLKGTTIATATTGERHDKRRYQIAIDRNASEANAAEQDRVAVLESWEQFDAQLGGVTGASGSVEIAGEQTVRYVDLDIDANHSTAVEYEQVGREFTIPLPPRARHADLTALLEQLGIPLVKPLPPEHPKD